VSNINSVTALTDSANNSLDYSFVCWLGSDKKLHLLQTSNSQITWFSLFCNGAEDL